MLARKAFAPAVLAACIIAAGACQELEVNNTNAPDRNEALFDPINVEALGFGTWKSVWYDRAHEDTPWAEILPAYGEATTLGDNSSGQDIITEEPRRRPPNQAAAFGDNPEHDHIFRIGWEEWGEGVANANDVLWAIEDVGLVINTIGPSGGEEDNTARLKTWAKLLQGLHRGYSAMMFDVGFYINEETIDDVSNDFSLIPDPTPYAEFVPYAIDELAEAADLAAAGHGDIPPEVVVGTTLTSDDTYALANGWAARIASGWARTPSERQNDVDWNQVISFAENGPDAIIYNIATNQDSFSESRFILRLERQTSSDEHFRLDYRMIGPADVSGQFQDWWDAPLTEMDPFFLHDTDAELGGDIAETPDRRIWRPEGHPIDGAEGGKYTVVRYEDYYPQTDEPYRDSYYQYYRWENGGRNVWNSGPIPIMGPDEMNLLRAEGYIRLGQPALAVPLINQTRVANGELPPVTAAGVPAGADCVPKWVDGSCGDLLHAMWYERSIELLGYGTMLPWFTNRAFEEGLPCGSILQFPRHARELVVLGVEPYSFGGAGLDDPYGSPYQCQADKIGG